MNTKKVMVSRGPVPPVVWTSLEEKERHEARTARAELDTARLQGLKIRSVDAGRDFLSVHLENGSVLKIYCDGEWVEWEIIDEVTPIGFQNEAVWKIESHGAEGLVEYPFPRKFLAERLSGRSVRMLTIMVKCFFLAFDSFQYMFTSRLDMTDNTYVLLYHEENE